jgi:hypothetical protein
MSLPNYDPSNVDLTPDEHLGVEPLYRAVQLAQKKFEDGFQVEDLLSVPEIAAEARKTIEYILRGDKDDPTDDDAIAERMLVTGFGLARASQLLKKEEAPT